MRMQSILLIVSTVLMLAVGSGVAQATVWDAYADFSSTSNTSSNTWQYMYATAPGAPHTFATLSTYGALNSTESGGTYTWDAWNTGNADCPFIGVNDDEIEMHPGWPGNTQNYAPAVVWKSPITGTVDVTFSLVDREAHTDIGWVDGVNYLLDLYGDGAAVPYGTYLNQGVLAEGGDTGIISVPNVSVRAGNLLSLEIYNGANYYYDLTGITFTIDDGNDVPEPSAIVLMTVGLFGLLAYAWRKRK